MKFAPNYYVYIVKRADGFYHVSVTNDVHRRIEHNEGLDPNCFASLRAFCKYSKAIAYEKQLKGF